MSRHGRITPSMVVAFAALVAALGGTAVAAKKYRITSTAQIKPSVLAQLKGQTGPAGAKGDTGAAGAKGDTGAAGTDGIDGADGTGGTEGSATTTQTVAGEATTTSASEVALDGPSVTVNVPTDGAIVMLGANFDSKNANGANNSWAAIYEGDTRLNGVGGGASSTYVRRHGATNAIAADAGSHTYTMRYQSPSGTVASFQNRTLIVTVLG